MRATLPLLRRRIYRYRVGDVRQIQQIARKPQCAKEENEDDSFAVFTIFVTIASELTKD
jgi:hypothetical protein